MYIPNSVSVIQPLHYSFSFGNTIYPLPDCVKNIAEFFLFFWITAVKEYKERFRAKPGTKKKKKIFRRKTFSPILYSECFKCEIMWKVKFVYVAMIIKKQLINLVFDLTKSRLDQIFLDFRFRNFRFKGTLMQIWKIQFIFRFIWKQYLENFALLIQGILELFTRESLFFLKISLIFKIFYCLFIFVYKHFIKKGAHIWKSKQCYNAKPSAYYFYMRAKIPLDFCICLVHL